MNKKILYLITLLTLLGVAQAGTVTLTGGCSLGVLKGNTTSFSIHNSGNDTAYNMVLTPVVQNAQPLNSTYAISDLGPGITSVINVTFKNIKMRGTSGGYFIAAYQQGGSVFTAVFPCLLSFYSATASQILLSSNSTHTENGSVISISAFNAGSSAFEANISLILPPTLSYGSNKYFLLDLRPYQTKEVNFSIVSPTGGAASYSVAAMATYSMNNLSHASFTNFIVSSAKQSRSDFGSLFLIIAMVVVAMIILLLFLSLRKRRKQVPVQE